jgi:cyanophycin synthetase
MFGQRRAFRVGGLSVRFAQVRSNAYRRIWEQAATAVGAELDDLGDEFLVLCRKGASTVVRQHLVALDDGPTMELAGNKTLVHRLLSQAGVPVPRHVEVDADNLEPALQFLAGEAEPCVVKPASGTGGGAGVSGSVRSGDDLSRVCLAGGRWGRRILVEQTMVGNEYRLLFLDSELLDAVQRRPPRIRADGRSSIVELILAENERRANAPAGNEFRAIRLDLDLELTLRQAGFSLTSVPPLGSEVIVKTAVSENASSDNTTVRDLSPALIRDAARAARAVHLRLAGVDLVTPDPTVSLVEAGGAILEVNSPPGLHYHYNVAELDGATSVAVPVLERLLSDAHATGRATSDSTGTG